MKNHLVFALAILFAGYSSLTAQTNHRRQPAHLSPPNMKVAGTGKTTGHEDTPSLCYYFEWVENTSQWDSTEMVTMAYDPAGHETDRISYTYTPGSGFEPASRNAASYNSLGKLDTMTFYYGNPSQWIPTFRMAYHFDSKGNIDQTLYYNYNSAWDTNAIERTSYDYVFNNRIAGQTMYQYNLGNQSWDSVYKILSHFPNASGWDTSYMYLWNGSSWDAGDRKIATWHDFDNDWPISQVTATHNGQTYENELRIRGQYPSASTAILRFDEWSGSTWDSLYMETYAFDNHENDTLYEFFEWQGSWVLTDGVRSLFTYSVDGNALDQIEKEFDGITYVNTNRYTCPEFFTDAAEPLTPTQTVTAFPNPCSDRLNLQLKLSKPGPAAVILMDPQGRIALASQLTAPAGEVLLPIELPQHLAAGMYTYIVRSQEGNASGKVVVQR